MVKPIGLSLGLKALLAPDKTAFLAFSRCQAMVLVEDAIDSYDVLYIKLGQLKT